MAYSEIIKLNLENEYKPQIKGLGEIYEKTSVSYLQRRLIKKYQGGVLFLSSNKEHRGRGLTKEELEVYVKKQHYQILISGFIDSPPWISNPKKSSSKAVNFGLLIFISKAIFWFLVRLEKLWEGKKHSHMVFCFVKNKYNDS